MPLAETGHRRTAMTLSGCFFLMSAFRGFRAHPGVVEKACLVSCTERMLKPGVASVWGTTCPPLSVPLSLFLSQSGVTNCAK